MKHWLVDCGGSLFVEEAFFFFFRKVGVLFLRPGRRAGGTREVLRSSRSFQSFKHINSSSLMQIERNVMWGRESVHLTVSLTQQRETWSVLIGWFGISIFIYKFFVFFVLELFDLHMYKPEQTSGRGNGINHLFVAALHYPPTSPLPPPPQISHINPITHHVLL